MSATWCLPGFRILRLAHTILIPIGSLEPEGRGEELLHGFDRRLVRGSVVGDLWSLLDTRVISLPVLLFSIWPL